MDLFGFKRRKAARVEGYKSDYREMDPELRKIHRDTFMEAAARTPIRTQAMMEWIQAMIEVEREESQSGDTKEG